MSAPLRAGLAGFSLQLASLAPLGYRLAGGDVSPAGWQLAAAVGLGGVAVQGLALAAALALALAPCSWRRAVRRRPAHSTTTRRPTTTTTTTTTKRSL